MADQKTRLKFKANIEETVKLTFDEPRTGEGPYGEWFMYGCLHKGEEKVFFPSKTLHTMIQMCEFGDGSEFKVLKNEGDDGKMFFTLNGKTFDQLKENPEASKEDIPF